MTVGADQTLLVTDGKPRNVDPEIIPEDEEARLAAVRRYDVLDSPPDGSFDRLTALAARSCSTPMAIISIVDRDRIWFKSHHGLDVDQIDREPGLCASAILQDGPWVVEDARADPRTFANPLVAGDFGLGFYLGVPLQTSDGYQLGTLCVLDPEPRPASDREIADLTDLAAVVVDELELRRSAQRLIALESEQRRGAEALAGVLQESLLPAVLTSIDGLDLGARYVPADRERVGGDFYDAFLSGASAGLIIGDVSGHGPLAASLTSTARHTLRALGRNDWTPAGALTDLNETIITARLGGERRFATVAAVRLDPGPRRGFVATVSLAGHPPPLVLRTDGSLDEIGDLAPILGWRPTAVYTDVSLLLDVGDVLVLFTDGVVDAADDRGERFGDLRLRAVLAGLPGLAGKDGYGAEEVAAAVVDAATAFADEPRDDLAVLVAIVT